ncbi:unnamed protein product [Thelazia callipaeda]|uniref:M-phase phosphoprotein 6 n=1 Tax=Thelazia callipaeda TaxID=103827 RepID=A0A0N5D5V2_THECL|nr:unnamed protein product [Thelazia callipaeda]
MNDTKGLSSALLQMKKTKTRIEEASEKKRKKAIERTFYSRKRKAEEEKAPDLNISYENRIEVLEDLVFGRLSFNGFNPEVEKLMKYYKDLKEGVVTDEVTVDAEQEITDCELANSVFGNRRKRKIGNKRHKKQNIGSLTGECNTWPKKPKQ